MSTHTREWYEDYAKEHDLELGKAADKIIEGVNRCFGYCPCKYTMIKKTNPALLPTIVCPCDNHMNEINETGHCHCTLFYKKQLTTDELIEKFKDSEQLYNRLIEINSAIKEEDNNEIESKSLETLYNFWSKHGVYNNASFGAGNNRYISMQLNELDASGLYLYCEFRPDNHLLYTIVIKAKNDSENELNFDLVKVGSVDTFINDWANVQKCIMALTA